MDTWFRTPLLLRFGVIAALWAAYCYAVLVLNTSETNEAIGLFVMIASAVGGFLTVQADLQLDKRFESIDQFRAYREALRSGSLPARADKQEWRRWLRASRWANRAALVIGAPYLVFGLMSASGSQRPYHLALVLLGVAAASGGAQLLLKRTVQIRRLAAEVKLLPVVPAAVVDEPVEEVAPAAQPAAPAAKLSWREQGYQSTLPTRVVMSAMIGLVTASAVLLLADLEAVVYGGPHIMDPVWELVLVGLFAVVCAAIISEPFRERDFESYRQHDDYETFVRIGALPSDLDIALWRRRLRASQRENHIKLIGATILVTAGGAALVSGLTGYHIVVAGLFELVALWLLLNWWRLRQRLTAMADAVESLE